MEDSIQKRGHALEEIFFQHVDQLLIEKMRNEMKAEETVDALAHASGISAKDVLKSLVDLGVSAESLVCVSLIPLVAVAWADGIVQKGEENAILKAAAENGIAEGSSSYGLLVGWLKKQPASDLLDVWKAYMQAVKAKLDATAFHQMSESILDRAEQIATASGAFFKIVAVSESEKHVLQELRETLK